MNGTQVTDIEKKVDYPKFKKGMKLQLTEEQDSPQDENVETITQSVSSIIDGKVVNYELASKISSNMKAESEAIEFYNELLNEEGLLPEDIEQIREFISDEKNHLHLLSEMVKHYDGNIPTAED